MMIRRSFTLLAAVAALALAVPAVPAPAQDDLYGRMQRINTGLNSYQSDVSVHVEMHSLPYLNQTFSGRAYFKKPDKAAVQFDTVPVLANLLKKVVGQMEMPSDWPKLYDVTKTSDDGNVAVFRLVRKKNGRIDHVDAKVDDKTATVTEMTYFYKQTDGGGSVRFANQYDEIGGNYLLKVQTGKVDIPHYNADLNTSFANYKINIPIDDQVFKD
jgi:outer membrane lipoprotein-sorting protein